MHSPTGGIRHDKNLMSSDSAILTAIVWSAGRADYFGNLPNLAARVMTLALPGQVLLEGFQGFGPELVHRDEQSALLPQQPSRIAGHPDYEAVEVLQLGKFPIKVHQSLAQVCWNWH